jgi:DNA topoisomerase-1
MEEDLDKIEEGKKEYYELLKNFYVPFLKVLEKAKKEQKRIKVEPEETDIVCEKCGKKMVIRTGKYGKFLSCSGYPECKNVRSLNKTGVSCPNEGCNGKLIRRKGKKGFFYGCSKYPECKYITKWLPKKQKEKK